MQLRRSKWGRAKNRMTDPEGPNPGSAPERLGVPDVARDVHGPVGQLDFPGSVALCCPHPVSALGCPCTPSGPMRVQPKFASAAEGIPPPLPGWLTPPRPSLPGMPSAGAVWPRPLRPGPMAPRPSTSHRPARPGHAQCGRSGLGPGSARAAAGCRRGGSSGPR